MTGSSSNFWTTWNKLGTFLKESYTVELDKKQVGRASDNVRKNENDLEATTILVSAWTKN